MSKSLDEIRHLFSLLNNACSRSIDFFSANFGLRQRGAPPLDLHDDLRLRINVRTIAGAIILCVVGFVYLVRSVRNELQTMLGGGDPLPDLERFLDGLSLRRAGMYAIAGMGLMLGVWILTLAKRFRVNPLLCVIPLPLIGAPLLFDSTNAWVYRDQLRQLFERGVSHTPYSAASTKSAMEDALSYFNGIRSLTADTFVGDNVLGRIAGAHYWLGDYEKAARLYKELLQQYPNSNIRKTVHTSLQWSLNRLGRQFDAAEAARFYEELELSDDGISVFRFYLEAPVDPDRVPFTQFASITGRRRIAITELLELYPNDHWSPRAAFLVGDRHRLADDRSPWGLAHLVVEGLELQRLQRFEDAAARYKTYIALQPSERNTDTVRSLLAQCYLRDENLNRAMEQTVALAGFPHKISPRIDHRVLRRFAYEPDIESMIDVYDTFHGVLPVPLAVDMAEVLAERLTLLSDPRAATVLAHARLHLRDADPTRRLRPYGNFRALRVGDYTASRFRSTASSSISDVINSRLAETRRDRRRFHFFDRHYGQVSLADAGIDRLLYSDLLATYAKRLIHDELNTEPDLQARLMLALSLDKSLRIPGLIDESISCILGQIISNETVVSHDAGLALRSLRNRREHADRIEEILRVLIAAEIASQSQTLSASSLSRAMDLLLILPRARLAEQLIESIEQHLSLKDDPLGDHAFVVATRMENALRISPRRDGAEPILAESIYKMYRRAAESFDSPQRRRAILGMALYCLRRPGLYPIARDIFVDYLESYPGDAFSENCHLWLGWLACYDAYQSRSVLHECVNNYNRALAHYDWIIVHGKQPRVVLNARHAAHRIRLHINLIASGQRHPSELPIPLDFVPEEPDEQ